ncbi:hypothetical protein HW115_08530 [Verrucomicrobiaceae bacterium N1E253]|uniref:Uncharacterized protein n=1 Tax=Oceaniferula marina TaxID=2748318 RepID=A0A851GKF4_9BACT|nr:hypothetical protein [Oceaniferula marina]NWK55655.1 hypothetical protein [Oceaniferula marina]
MIEVIEKSLLNHNTKRTTCQMAGISTSTLYHWLSVGETAKSGLKRELWVTVNKAQSISKTILVNQIAKDSSWQSKAWLLERMYPNEFGRQQKVNHTTGADGESLNTMPPPIINIIMQDTDEESPWIYDVDPT